MQLPRSPECGGGGSFVTFAKRPHHFGILFFINLQKGQVLLLGILEGHSALLYPGAPCPYKKKRNVFWSFMIPAASGSLIVSSLRTDGFFRKIQKMHFSPKMDESRKKWYHQKVLLTSFPMNGHVDRFRQS
jgi:hypothetical protein